MAETAAPVKPLPTPLQLSNQLTAAISGIAKCNGSWEQHKGPLTLPEMLAIKTVVNRLLTEEVNRYVEETHKP